MLRPLHFLVLDNQMFADVCKRLYRYHKMRPSIDYPICDRMGYVRSIAELRPLQWTFQNILTNNRQIVSLEYRKYATNA